MWTRVVSDSLQSSRSAICPLRPSPLYEISASCSSFSSNRMVSPPPRPDPCTPCTPRRCRPPSSPRRLGRAVLATGYRSARQAAGTRPAGRLPFVAAALHAALRAFSDSFSPPPPQPAATSTSADDAVAKANHRSFKSDLLFRPPDPRKADSKRPRWPMRHTVAPWRSTSSSAIRSLFGPVAGPPARAADRAPRRCAAVGEAGRRQLGPRLRRQQDAEARVPARRRARAGLRHARLDRRRAVEPHAPGRGGRRARRAEAACSSRRAGSTGPTPSTTASATSCSAGSWAPTCGSSRPSFGIGFKESWEQALADVEAAGGKPYAIPAGASDHPLGGLGYAALGAGGRRAGGGARRLLRHRDRLLGDRLDAGGHGRRLRRAGAAAPCDRDRRLREAARRRRSR